MTLENETLTIRVSGTLKGQEYGLEEKIAMTELDSAKFDVVSRRIEWMREVIRRDLIGKEQK